MTFGGQAEKVKIVLPLQRELDFEGRGSEFRSFCKLFCRPLPRRIPRRIVGDFGRFGVRFGHPFWSRFGQNRAHFWRWNFEVDFWVGPAAEADPLEAPSGRIRLELA